MLSLSLSVSAVALADVEKGLMENKHSIKILHELILFKLDVL